jgi:hypothetical protein
MAEPQIAPRAPVACAACFGQYPERVHVDFRSAMNGPQVDPSVPRSPHIDWVVICESCIRSAVNLLPKVADQRENLGRQLADANRRAEAAENYASSLEDALQRRPDAEAPQRDQRPKRAKRTPKPSANGAKPARQPRYSQREATA